MGIYSNGDVYAVSLFLNNTIIFERKYDEKLIFNQILEIKEFYEKLSLEDKNKLSISFYTSCSSTYNVIETELFMSWLPGDRKELQKLFDIIKK